jgi:hypothetical protein
MLGDLRAFMREDSPYRKLRVMPHLDHGFRGWMAISWRNMPVICFDHVRRQRETI